MIYNQEDNTKQDFFDYMVDFEKLEDLCIGQMIEADVDLYVKKMVEKAAKDVLCFIIIWILYLHKR